MKAKKGRSSFVLPPFFRDFALSDGEFTPSRQKKEQVPLFCSRLFVTLEEFAGFLYIKAVWEIEDFEGYG